MSSSDAPDQTTQRIIAGDADAFETVFREQYEPLLRFAAGHVGYRTEAEDVVQEVLLRIWRDRERIGADRPLKPYIFAAVRNEIIDRARRQSLERKWQRPFAETETGGMGLGEMNAPDPAHNTDPVELSELEDAVRSAVASLPERCRTAFLLCREEGLTYAEVAEAMGTSAGTVRIQMSRALAALRIALRPLIPTIVGFMSIMP